MAKKFAHPIEIKIEKLLLDPKNPRIPEDKQALSQEELTLFVAETYNSVAIAQSIASHQYFPSEPLIAMPLKGQKGYLVVLEGNRRLAALKLLNEPSLKARLSNKAEWNAINTNKIPDQVPVLIVKSRREVAPIIGYRHISGIQPWDSYSKARYIAAQIEGGLSFDATAIEVGEKKSEVRSNYRNYQIAEQALKSGIDPETSNELINNFGVFTRAMQSKDLRDFIGAPAPDAVSTKKLPIPAKKKDALKELVSFLFGPTAVLGESRDITKLGKVISSPEGLDALRKERNLELAHVASGGLLDTLLARLNSSASTLRAAKKDIVTYKNNTDVKRLLEECREALDDLEELRK
ncbi:MAG: hypothetical protein WC787_02000 [Patescibacteria group bacterium]|jgi:hypothetical protein